MNVIIAGSRHFDNYRAISGVIKESEFDITKILCGMASSGVDRCAYAYAINNCIPVNIFPAKWKVYGKAAGPIRNESMAKCADALIVIWDGRSRGTKNMIANARKYKLKLWIVTVDENEWDAWRI